jgi:hypothetical protein
MPALNGCICGTAFVTCIESALPREAAESDPQTGPRDESCVLVRTWAGCRSTRP